jgi:hypothetical protein
MRYFISSGNGRNGALSSGLIRFTWRGFAVIALVIRGTTVINTSASVLVEVNQLRNYWGKFILLQRVFKTEDKSETKCVKMKCEFNIVIRGNLAEIVFLHLHGILKLFNNQTQ